MTEDFRADLHCHTTCSDGTYTPEDVLKLAHGKQLQGLSITDHDTIQAYAQAVPLAEKYQLLLLSGVEFSSVHRGHSVHLLAYSFPLNSPIIQEFCQRHTQRRQRRNEAILERLAKEGMPLSIEDLHQAIPSSSTQTIGRPHIAMAMMSKGYVSSIQQAFQQYIGEGKSCYVSGHAFNVEETLDVIHRAHGLAIIAHPHLIDNETILKDLISMDFDGIEAYYGRFSSAQHQRWVQIGRQRNWILTGGSDFHGDIKPNLPLGSSWVNQETFELLYQHFIHQT